MKAKYTTGLVLLILLASLIQWPQATAITPQDQTISITDTHDDLFITETGIGIDSQLCHILDPTMDIRSFLVFRELEINYWEPLENATLRLRTTATLDFDADSSVTVYGMRYSDLQVEGWLTPGWVLSVPITSASVSVNTSQFYGQTWHEVNVTSIVEELIRSYDWDGDGIAGTETGDAIGFIILGAEGYDTRWFIDYLYGTPTLAPQLVIHWNHEPPPPTGYDDAEYNETYRGYDIWSFNGTDFGWINYLDYEFYNISYGQYFAIVSEDVITGDPVSASDAYDFRLRRINPSQFGSKYLSINVTGVSDTDNANHQWPAHIFGHASENLNVFTIDNTLKKGVFLTVSSPTNNTADIFEFAITTHNAGTWNIAYGMTHRVDANLRYYFNVTYNYPSRDFNVDVYNSTSFDEGSFIENITRTGYVNIMTSYTNEFAFNTESRPAAGDHIHFNTLSMSGAVWIVTDENGTLISDDCLTLECAKIVIEAILGSDPEDPEPPGEEWSTGPGGETGAFTRFRMRLWFMLIGFGCMFGPVLFFAWRRPSGYYILCGAIVMLIGIGLLISIGQV